MARICEYYYRIELANGSFNKLKREEFINSIEDYYEDFLTNDIYSITKIYKLKDIKKIFKMTLFTSEYNFEPEEYIIEDEMYDTNNCSANIELSTYKFP